MKEIERIIKQGLTAKFGDHSDMDDFDNACLDGSFQLRTLAKAINKHINKLLKVQKNKLLKEFEDSLKIACDVIKEESY